MFDFKFDWNGMFETGIETIDTQHQQLFKIGRDLEQLLRIQCIGITDKEILDIVCGLRDYTAYHFYEEERIMDEMCYPKVTKHKAYHKKCFDFVMALDLPKIKEEPVEQLGKIRDQVQSWIMEHLLQEDVKMTKAYLKYQKQQRQAAARTAVQPEEMYGRLLAELDITRVYLFKNQQYKGHLVAVFKESARELAKMSALERDLFMADIAKAAKVLKKNLKPDAVCYLNLEDSSEELVFHIIPRYKKDGTYGVQPVIDYTLPYTPEPEYTSVFEVLGKAF